MYILVILTQLFLLQTSKESAKEIDKLKLDLYKLK